MRFLAENGPTDPAALREAIISETGTAESHMSRTLTHLRETGCVVVKVWLTPAGLRALQDIGMAPEFSGAKPAAPGEWDNVLIG
jgi:hypothetical protein